MSIALKPRTSSRDLVLGIVPTVKTYPYLFIFVLFVSFSLPMPELANAFCWI